MVGRRLAGRRTCNCHKILCGAALRLFLDRPDRMRSHTIGPPERRCILGTCSCGRRGPADGDQIVIKSSAELLYVCFWTGPIVFVRAALLSPNTRTNSVACSPVRLADSNQTPRAWSSELQECKKTKKNLATTDVATTSLNVLVSWIHSFSRESNPGTIASGAE